MLTARVIEISGMVASGLIEKQIADRLHIADSTVHAHTKNIRRKINAANIADITRNYLLTYDNTIRCRIATAFRTGGIIGFAKGRVSEVANFAKRSIQAVRPQTGNEVAPRRKSKSKKARQQDILHTIGTNHTHGMSNEIIEKIDRLMWLQTNCTTEELDELIRISNELKNRKNEDSERNCTND